jgi:hypothetical protein
MSEHDLPTTPQSPAFVAEVISLLTRRGAVVKVEEGVITIQANKERERREAMSRRNRRKYLKRRAKWVKMGEKRVKTPFIDHHHGIHLWEMPGKSDEERKCNLAMFKRGSLDGYEACRDLEGKDLRREFDRIKAERRKKAKAKNEGRSGRKGETNSQDQL